MIYFWTYKNILLYYYILLSTGSVRKSTGVYKCMVSWFWRRPGTSAPCAAHLTVSLFLCSSESNARGDSRALEWRSVSWKSLHLYQMSWSGWTYLWVRRDLIDEGLLSSVAWSAWLSGDDEELDRLLLIKECSQSKNSHSNLKKNYLAQSE